MIVVVIGSQWGDEGKGAVVDNWGKKADYFVRVQGGANAGHSVIVGGKKIVLHLVPSGVTYAQADCLLGNDMVIDPKGLIKEIDDLSAAQALNCKSLGISPLAHLVMPYCLELEKLREQARGNNAIGTTGRGIGPTYEMRARRLGIRMEHLRHLDIMPDYVKTILAEINPEIRHWGGQGFTQKDMLGFLEQYAPYLVPMIVEYPISVTICAANAKGENVLIEGAQGLELDITHGTYPFVTSSSTIAGGACSGAGIGPTMIKKVIGVTKAYCTRVGAGPFPTKINGGLAAQIQKRGNEFGATTGRPRDVGWVDATQLAHAARINGLTGLVITKGDVLQGIEPKICTHYVYQGRKITNFDELDCCELSKAEPIYETLPGFSEDISGCRKFEDLPKGAQELFSKIQTYAGVPILAISVGPERGQTIIMKDLWQ
ncbi:MAG: adenylosuccinate synthase [Candidatus Parcubacteria bacterium]|nr:adenylosuccinate synthase [Candidatus Parcubacteria bacterium]